MQHDEFIGQVQARARVPSRGDAERATRSTLETLGERLPEGLVDNLAAQLPVEIGEHLRRTVTLGGQGTGERFDRAEFMRRVSERSGADEPVALFQARAVLEVVGDAVQGGLMDRVKESLPPDLADVIEAGSTGNLSNGGS